MESSHVESNKQSSENDVQEDIENKLVKIFNDESSDTQKGDCTNNNILVLTHSEESEILFCEQQDSVHENEAEISNTTESNSLAVIKEDSFHSENSDCIVLRDDTLKNADMQKVLLVSQTSDCDSLEVYSQVRSTLCDEEKNGKDECLDLTNSSKDLDDEVMEIDCHNIPVDNKCDTVHVLSEKSLSFDEPSNDYRHETSENNINNHMQNLLESETSICDSLIQTANVSCSPELNDKEVTCSDIRNSCEDLTTDIAEQDCHSGSLDINCAKRPLFCENACSSDKSNDNCHHISSKSDNIINDHMQSLVESKISACGSLTELADTSNCDQVVDISNCDQVPDTSNCDQVPDTSTCNQEINKEVNCSKANNSSEDLIGDIAVQNCHNFSDKKYVKISEPKENVTHALFSHLKEKLSIILHSSDSQEIINGNNSPLLDTLKDLKSLVKKSDVYANIDNKNPAHGQKETITNRLMEGVEERGKSDIGIKVESSRTVSHECYDKIESLSLTLDSDLTTESLIGESYENAVQVNKRGRVNFTNAVSESSVSGNDCNTTITSNSMTPVLLQGKEILNNNKGSLHMLSVRGLNGKKSQTKARWRSSYHVDHPSELIKETSLKNTINNQNRKCSLLLTDTDMTLPNGTTKDSNKAEGESCVIIKQELMDDSSFDNAEDANCNNKEQKLQNNFVAQELLATLNNIADGIAIVQKRVLYSNKVIWEVKNPDNGSTIIIHPHNNTLNSSSAENGTETVLCKEEQRDNEMYSNNNNSVSHNEKKPQVLLKKCSVNLERITRSKALKNRETSPSKPPPSPISVTDELHTKPEVKPPTCKMCGLKCLTLNGLSHHKCRYCPLCQKTFASLKLLYDHKKSHCAADKEALIIENQNEYPPSENEKYETSVDINTSSDNEMTMQNAVLLENKTISPSKKERNVCCNTCGRKFFTLRHLAIHVCNYCSRCKRTTTTPCKHMIEDNLISPDKMPTEVLSSKEDNGEIQEIRETRKRTRSLDSSSSQSRNLVSQNFTTDPENSLKKEKTHSTTSALGKIKGKFVCIYCNMVYINKTLLIKHKRRCSRLQASSAKIKKQLNKHELSKRNESLPHDQNESIEIKNVASTGKESINQTVNRNFENHRELHLSNNLRKKYLKRSVNMKRIRRDRHDHLREQEIKKEQLSSDESDDPMIAFATKEIQGNSSRSPDLIKSSFKKTKKSDGMKPFYRKHSVMAYRRYKSSSLCTKPFYPTYDPAEMGEPSFYMPNQDYQGFLPPYQLNSKAQRYHDDLETYGPSPHLYSDLDNIYSHPPMEERYPCHRCFKICISYNHYKAHMHQHMIQDVYECPYCQKDFSSRNILEEHMKAAHLQHKQHVCKQCGECFSSSKFLYKHSLKHRHPKGMLK